VIICSKREHVDQERNINSVVENKVNKGIAGIDTIKKSDKP
jgi:hypothetical protein